nr:hypothetical protein [Tanacetum cinerariifolium]
MGRDTVRLEDTVSTISKEYLLEFISEYGIPESLHPELPGPEEPIVEFSEGKVGVYTKFFEFANYHMDLFNLISASNPTKVKTGTRPRAAHEVPLLTATTSRVIDMEDTAVASGSSGTPPALEKSPLDFADEDPPQRITERDGIKDQVQDGLSHGIPPVENVVTTEVVLEPGLKKEVAAMGPRVNKRRRKRGNDKAEANAPPKVLRKDHAAFALHKHAPTVVKSVSDPDPLSYVKLQLHPELDIAPCSHTNKSHVLHNVDVDLPEKRPSRSLSEMLLPHKCKARSQWRVQSQGNQPPSPPWTGRQEQMAMGSQLRLRFEQEVRLLKKATNKIAKRDQRIQAREEEIERLDQEIKSLRVVEAKVHGLRNQTKNLETLLEAKVDMKKAAEVKNVKLAKELESLRRCVKMDARLDKLSVDFDEELCMSEGLKHGIKHKKVDRDLAAVEAYDPEADSKYVKALQDLKDLKYPLVDQLERLKDAPMELIMASLYLKSDSEEDAPQWIRDLRSSSSQLKILMYPEVCDPEDHWVCKEEMLLEDVIAENKSWAEKEEVQGSLSYPWDWFRSSCQIRRHPRICAYYRSSRAGNSIGECRHTDRGG